MALAAAVAEEKENDLFRPPMAEEKDILCGGDKRGQ